MPNKIEFNVVINQNEFCEIFGIDEKDYPFNLNRNLKLLKKDNSNEQYVVDELTALYIRDPIFQSQAQLSGKDIKSCGVYKVRVKKENSNKGKSSGYRVITLLLTFQATAFVLDITDHSIQDDLTDEQKKFCVELAKSIDEAIKNE